VRTFGTGYINLEWSRSNPERRRHPSRHPTSQIQRRIIQSIIYGLPKIINFTYTLGATAYRYSRGDTVAGFKPGGVAERLSVNDSPGCGSTPPPLPGAFNLAFFAPFYSLWGELPTRWPPEKAPFLPFFFKPPPPGLGCNTRGPGFFGGDHTKLRGRRERELYKPPPGGGWATHHHRVGWYIRTPRAPAPREGWHPPHPARTRALPQLQPRGG